MPGTKEKTPGVPGSRASPKPLAAHLVETYGPLLDADGVDNDKAEEILLTLWSMMQCFADLGFSVRAGDKFHSESDYGFDDVLNWLHRTETAHETVAPPETSDGKEQP